MMEEDKKTVLEYDSPKPGQINFSQDPNGDCEVTIPNPSGNAPAVIIMQRAQVVQDMKDAPDALIFNYYLKFTEEQMSDVFKQWTYNDEIAKMKL